ncbi:MAG: Gfo/Idh/MocA family oxidoreductase [Lentisphaeria bacterium]|nr:Gfo/Idh/MocA family oxidoreductase [Lentisphaeria bacterium]
MAASDPIRFGAIGCGGAGTNRILQLAGHPLGLRVVAAADIRPERLENLEKQLGYGFAAYSGPEDFRKVVDDHGVDAVGIFTPHIPHYDHVKYAIERGRHVLIEKPMVCGTARAVEVTRMLANSGKVGLVHYQRHYEAKYILARDMIRKGVIGEVTSFYVYMAQDWSGRNWRGDPAFSGGGQLNDSGSHYQDILLWMTDLLPVSAEGFADSWYQGVKKDVEITGMFNVGLSNGGMGRIIIVGDILGGFQDDVRIRGTKGDIMFYGNQLLHRPTGGKIVEVAARPPRGYPVSPCDNFVKLLRGRSRVNRVPFLFGTRVALLTEAMLRSAREGGRRVLCEDILKESGLSLRDLA